MSDISCGGWSRWLGRTGALLLAAFTAVGPALAQSDFFVIQNRWSPDDLLNVEGDVPQASPLSRRAPEAQWLFEPAEESPYFRLLNIGTGLYLQNAGGQPVAAPLGQPGIEPDWSLESVPDIPDPRIQSRAGGYLHIYDGPLVIGDASPDWGESYWRISPASDIVERPPSVASRPGPVYIRRPRTGTYYIPIPIPLPFTISVRPPPLPICPPKHHLSKGHCCPPASSWSYKQQACVLQAAPVACPKGQHLSQGHCCPALQVWNKAKQHCVLQVFQPIFCPKGQHLSQGHCCPTFQWWNAAAQKCVAQVIKPIVKDPKIPKDIIVKDPSKDPKLPKDVIIKDPPKGPIIKDPPKGVIIKDPPKDVIVKDPPKVIVKDPPKVVKDPPKAVIIKDPPKVTKDPPKVVKDPPKAVIIKDPPKVKVVKDPPKVVKDPPKSTTSGGTTKSGTKVLCPSGKTWNEAQKKCG